MSRAVNIRTGEINYRLAVSLDAEDLAEEGVQEAYRLLVPHLMRYGIDARPINEFIDNDCAAYHVELDGRRYEISGPGVPERDSWGLATYALFDIVNRQMAAKDDRLFALYGGNDLCGVFMTPDQADLARRALHRKTDWPYLPTSEPAWFGMHHD